MNVKQRGNWWKSSNSKKKWKIKGKSSFRIWKKRRSMNGRIVKMPKAELNREKRQCLTAKPPYYRRKMQCLRENKVTWMLQSKNLLESITRSKVNCLWRPKQCKESRGTSLTQNKSRGVMAILLAENYFSATPR